VKVLPLPPAPRTRRVVFAYTVNRFGTWFGYIALAIYVYDRTGSELAVAALLISGQVLSALLVPALVARIETRSGRGGLSALYAVEAAATAVLALLAAHGFSLPAVLVLVAIDGTASLAASALVRTAAARTAREWEYEVAGLSGAGDAPAADQQLQERGLEAERIANSALNFGFALTFAVGPALAGLVVPAFGVPAALWVDVVSFLVCGALMLDLTPHVRPGEDASVRSRLRAAREHLGEVPALRILLIAEAVALTFFTFGGPLEVAYAKTSLDAGDSGYGLLVAVWGIGVTIGSLVFARSGARSMLSLLLASTLAVGLSYVVWWAAPTIAVAAIAGLFGGIGNGVQWAAMITSVQRLTPRSLHGQMMGAVEVLGAIAPAVGFALAGLIAVNSTPRVGFLVGGVGAVLSLLIFARLPQRALEPAAATG